MLHGIFPHNHHEHEQDNISTELHLHSHDSDEHHHHTESEQTESDKSLLELILVNHAHETNTNFPSEINSENDIKISPSQKRALLIQVFRILKTSLWTEKDDIYVNPKFSVYSHYYLQHLFLRGPPFNV